ncbi:hypothetical protein [Desulfovibrio desulfuricans]|uniref:hypothetical protein n=1 Tax=Desulfovibrio desulfuricans TaxID=876 RepID=UPI003983DD4F
MTKEKISAKAIGQMTDDEKAFAETLLDKLPPIIARHHVDRFLGGLISPYTIKNADLAGTGPEIAWRVGKKVAYKAESLVSWLVANHDVKRMVNLRAL